MPGPHLWYAQSCVLRRESSRRFFVYRTPAAKTAGATAHENVRTNSVGQTIAFGGLSPPCRNAKTLTDDKNRSSVPPCLRHAGYMPGSSADGPYMAGTGMSLRRR